MQARRFFAGGLVAWISLACSAPNASPTGSSAAARRTTHALAGGSIDPDTSAVFALEVTAPEPRLCTAVLVAPNLLLTARHCISVDAKTEVVCGESPLDTLVEPDAVLLDNVLSYLDAPRPGEQTPAIARFEVPPDGSDTCGYDLAALVLEHNFVETPPLALRLTAAPEIGERYSAVGYGQSMLSEGSRAGVRLRLDDQSVRCLGGKCTIPTTTTEFGGDDGVCLGDSGGPAIDSQGRVFGIASRSKEGCRAAVYTSLPAFGDWLDQLWSEAAELGGYDRVPPATDPEPAAEEPEPATATTASNDPPLAQLDDACDAELACEPTLACVYETTPDEARCRERCREAADCTNDQICDPDALVCWTPPSATEADCALGHARAGSGIGAMLVILVGMVGGRCRRRAKGRARA